MLNLNFTPFPVMFTPRLLLRQIGHEDENELFFLRSDERVMQYIDRPLVQSMEEITALIEKISTALTHQEGISWAVCLKDYPRLVGTVALWRIVPEHFRAEIGYMLNPAYQGLGLMHEAMKAILDYGFNVMKLHSVEANVNPANKASIRLLENHNFVREAYFRENYYFNGKFLDSAIYSLLEPAFKQLKATPS